MQKEVVPTPAPRRLPTRRPSRRSGYAFSHSQGYGALVTSRKFLKPRNRKALKPALFMENESALVQNQPQFYRTIPEEAEGSQVSQK